MNHPCPCLPNINAARGSASKIDIKLPPRTHIGYDPFENPNEEFLPIDDSFNQPVLPVDKDGHIAFRSPKTPISDKPRIQAAEDEDPVNGHEPIQLEEQLRTMAVGEDGINERDYNHGLLPREDINRMLRNVGDFLLRATSISGNGNRQMCLSVMRNLHHVEHFLILSSDKKFWLTEDMSFPSITSLVNHYFLKKVPFGSPPVTLNMPVCRQDWELSPDQVNCLKQIATGTFFQLFYGKLRCRGQETDVEVAIKAMKIALMTKRKIQEMMKEARLMRMLRHDNILRCYGVSVDIEPLMIVTEFVKGGALDEYLKNRNIGITIDDRIEMAYDAALGLNHITRHGILHRDIAARNCLYGKKNLKISGFSLSRLATSLKVDPAERAPLRSLAPEVFITQVYTTASDVWAYGVLLWEIFHNGAELYRGWTGAQIRDEVIKKGTTLVLPDWTPQFMKETFKKVLVVDPAKRINCHEVIVSIEIAKKKRLRELQVQKKNPNGKTNMATISVDNKEVSGNKTGKQEANVPKTKQNVKKRAPTLRHKVGGEKEPLQKAKPKNGK